MTDLGSGRTVAGSRVQASLRLGGLLIAVTQGAVLPSLGFITGRDFPVSTVAIAVAAGMMGVSWGIGRDRRRREESE